MSAQGRRRRFTATCGFQLDPFQDDALDAIDAGHSVLVSAPTGSGKTVVAEYAVEVALEEGARVFYTAPIKALSNQKYLDLLRRHGSERVGLLTGDNSINGDAPIVVMTTEVLRNMIYARSEGLERLRWVVLDEVHYLQDAYRGPVWEEVIIHAPAQVRLVCLSATVSNATELAEWITTVRGPTEVVVEHERPVRLTNHYLVGDRHTARLRMIETVVAGQPNREGERFDPDPRGSRRRERRWYTPRRVEVIELLAQRRLLPAITFIFSRNGCDDAVRACQDAGLVLTAPAEAARIRAIVEEQLGGMDGSDLEVLGYERWLRGLEAGLASHHAGMVPPFKETVEVLFAAGLVKAVFATETLSLGINMPARTVVIEKLSKFGGERHDPLTPGQYHQLTGRAGRRGIDDAGHAIVLWSPFEPFSEVARLATSRSFELISAFRPTYNMAANLIRRYGEGDAVRMLEQSFAQFQADRTVVRLRKRIEQRSEVHARVLAESSCELGDVREYRELRDSARGRHQAPEAEVSSALAALRPGDVIRIDGGTSAGPAVVVSTAERRGGGRRLRLLGSGRHLVTMGPRDFRAVPAVLGRIELPRPFAPNSRAFLRELRRRLQQAELSEAPGARPEDRRREATRVLRRHPVAGCAELEGHLRALRQLDRLERELESLRRQQQRRSANLAGHFERLLDLLESWGHVTGWSLTPAGELLVRIYHECDILVAEALREGLLDGLDPPTLAGVVASLTYEHRSPQPPPAPWFPPGPMRRRIEELQAIARGLNRDEAGRELPLTRLPEPGFSGLAHAWASGDALVDLLSDEELTGGDFVRNVKQLIDLLRQIGEVAPEPETARAARQAVDSLLRGVVLASSVIHDDGGGEASSEDTP